MEQNLKEQKKMGCFNSNGVVDECEVFNDKKISKTVFSVLSKKSIFSRKRTKKTKMTNKVSLIQDEVSVNDSQKSSPIKSIKIIKPKKRKVKQIRKKITALQIIQLNNILSRHQSFFKLKKQQKVIFIEQLKLYEVKKGKYLFEKGQLPQRLYIVKEGLLQTQTFNKDFPFLLLQKNSFIGQIDLIFDTERTHSVLVKQNSKLWGLQKQKLDELKSQFLNESLPITKAYLQKVSIFTYLSDQEIDLLCQKTYLFKYRSNQLIFHKGDSSEKLFIIISGEIELHIPNKNNLILKSGEVFGQGCLKQNPVPRAGTAICFTESRCLVISRKDIFKCLGNDNVANITNFSVLKWAFKRSTEFKDQSSKQLYKIIQKGKTKFFKDGQNIFNNNESFSNFYLVALQGTVNEHGVGVFVNCLQNKKENYIKNGDGSVFVLQIKKPKVKIGNNKQQKMLNSKQIKEHLIQSKIHEKKQKFVFQSLQSFMKDLILVRKIRSLDGGKGEFYNVFHKSEGKLYNIWCLKKYQISENQIAQKIINQKNILTKTQNCSFISCYNRAFNDDHHIYFVFKNYINGSLQWLLERHRTFKKETILHLLSCLIIGIQYMHLSMKIVHRNICLENILLDEMGYFCIDNFQNAKNLNQKDSRTDTIIGTPQYFAPQMISGNGYSYEVDYWALGVIIYRLVFGNFPFINSSNDPFDIFKHIIKNKVQYKTKSDIDPNLIQFIRMLLASNPKNRVPQNISGIRSHSLFEDVDWEQIQKKSFDPPFNIDKFCDEKINKKLLEDGKNYFSNFISKQKKKIQHHTKRNQQDFKQWDFHFN